MQAAAETGITTLCTWTQGGNTPMITLNDQLGYARGRTGITLKRPLPL